MITILPLRDEEQKQERLRHFPQMDKSADVLVMRERDTELGWVLASCSSSVLRIWHMEVAGQELSHLDGQGRMIADSLLRAGASYGASFGAYQIAICVPELNREHYPAGFWQEGDWMVAPMDAIVKLCKPQANG